MCARSWLILAAWLDVFPAAYLLGLDEASETLERLPVLLSMSNPAAQGFPSPLLAQLPQETRACGFLAL